VSARSISGVKSDCPNLNIVYEQKQYKNKAAFTRRFNKTVYKKRRGDVVLRKQIPFSVLCA
jgi:hypothetical protein